MYFIEMTLAVNHGNELLFIVIVIVIVIIHCQIHLSPNIRHRANISLFYVTNLKQHFETVNADIR